MRDVRFLIAIIALALLAIVPIKPCNLPWSKAGSAAPQRPEESVVFNTQTLKYHCRTCQLALNCGSQCIVLPLSEARRRHGSPCEQCGGTCAPAATGRR